MNRIAKAFIAGRREDFLTFILMVLPFLLVVFVSVGVRFYDVGKPAIWSDEAFTLILSVLPPSEIIAHTIRDVHPPLYYLILHAWMVVFGNGVFAARSLSALAGVGSVLLGIWLVSLISSRRSALLGGLLLALLPMAVRYSQEVRMYAIFGALMLGAAIAFLYWVSEPRNIKPLAVFSILMVLGFYTHYFAGICMVSFWCFLLYLYFRRKDSCLCSPMWWMANLFVILLYIPWVPSLIHQLEYSGFSWVLRPDLPTIASAIWSFVNYSFGGELWLWFFYGVPLTLLGLSLIPVVYGGKERDGVRFLFLYTWLPLPVVVAVSFVRPLFVDRYLLFAALGLPLILGVMLNVLWPARKVWFLVLIGSILFLELSGLYNVHQRGHAVYMEVNKVDELAGYVNSHVRKGDNILVVNMYLYFPFSYYNQTGIVPVFFTPPGVGGVSTRPEGYQIWTLIQGDADKVYIDSLDDVVSASGRVWLLNTEVLPPRVPDYWHSLDFYRAGDSYAQLYEISSKP